MSKILSMAPSQEDLWKKAEEQGYVWIKTKDGFITKDDLSAYNRIKTMWYDVYLNQETYGIKWAFTKEELQNGK